MLLPIILKTSSISISNKLVIRKLLPLTYVTSKGNHKGVLSVNLYTEQVLID